jgi:hypothetical protein
MLPKFCTIFVASIFLSFLYLYLIHHNVHENFYFLLHRFVFRFWLFFF